MILVTGGAGFIGSNFICEWLARHNEPIVNLDALTYAGNLENLKEVEGDNRHSFVHGNILDEQLLINLFNRFHPRAVIHFAAESHVDRSIVNPSVFVDTNVKGTTTLLNVALHYWEQLNPEDKATFRLINISTDEVYGSLSATDAPKTENDAFNPSSPYSASKAAADQFGRAYFRTYQFPVITVRCSNNYGPKQYPEKLIPLMLTRALADQSLPVYGNGQQIRDWIHVSDFCNAIRRILADARPGDIFNVSANNELQNLELIHRLITQLDLLSPKTDQKSRIENIVFVKDRLGHDVRYSMNSSYLQKTLQWHPAVSFEKGLKNTVEAFLSQVNR